MIKIFGAGISSLAAATLVSVKIDNVVSSVRMICSPK
jgi:hypothetical protein